ncbi:MAG: ATP-binding protein [Sediminibacterium sp.]|nr:ATP-binding protein [Sediminibacterium sp.]
MIDEVIQQIRYISLNLYPFLIAKVGLKNALVELVDKSFKKEKYFYSYYISDDIDAIQKDKAVDLYRIMQELFSNIIKHAGASEINIEIVKEVRYYCVKVSDNGRGFNYQQERTKNTLGLTSIIERVKSLKGSVDFRSGKEGTQVSIRF